MSSYGNVYSTLILVFEKAFLCLFCSFLPLIVTSNMYMVKRHTLDLKTDKGLFNSSQIILYFHVCKLPYDRGLGSQR